MIISLAMSLLAVACLGIFLWRRNICPSPFGVANAITLFRNMLTAIIINALVFDFGPDENLIILSIALVALFCDGLDGYAARKLGTSSAFGARFDMESDAFFILILCAAAIINCGAPVWILAIGLMRYVYIALQSVFSELTNPIKDRYSRKVVCVIQIVSLLIPFAQIMPQPVWEVLLGLSLVLLVVSFGRDMVDQFRYSAQEV